MPPMTFTASTGFSAFHSREGMEASTPRMQATMVENIEVAAVAATWTGCCPAALAASNSSAVAGRYAISACSSEKEVYLSSLPA